MLLLCCLMCSGLWNFGYRLKCLVCSDISFLLVLFLMPAYLKGKRETNLGI